MYARKRLLQLWCVLNSLYIDIMCTTSPTCTSTLSLSTSMYSILLTKNECSTEYSISLWYQPSFSNGRVLHQFHDACFHRSRALQTDLGFCAARYILLICQVRMEGSKRYVDDWFLLELLWIAFPSGLLCQLYEANWLSDFWLSCNFMQLLNGRRKKIVTYLGKIYKG